MSAAASRAAHLLVDSEPFIFEDRMAERLLDEQGEAMIPYHRASGSHPVLAGTRLAVTTRSRYAEEHLAAAAMRPIAELCSDEQAHLFVRGLTLGHLDATLRRSGAAERFLAADVEAELATRGVDAIRFRGKSRLKTL